MRAHVLTILCKFGSDRAIFGVVVAIPAKKFTDTRTDTQTDDRRRAIAWAHSLNELKTANQLKSIETTMVSINLADELVILLIFVNDKHFVNTVTMGKVSHADRMGHADAA